MCRTAHERYVCSLEDQIDRLERAQAGWENEAQRLHKLLSTTPDGKEIARLKKLFGLLDHRVSSENGWVQLVVDEALGHGEKEERRRLLKLTGLDAKDLEVDDSG